MQIKKSLRAELLDRRRALPDHVRAAKSEALCQRLWALMQTRPHARLFAFASVHGEPDLLPLAARLIPGSFLLPYADFAKRSLSFYVWNVGDPLQSNRYGIPEPSQDIGVAASLSPDDVIAVPAVALTVYGDRLGYGGGFYDRFLVATPALVVGVVFDEFVLSALPVEDHDTKVQMIVTDQRSLKLTE